MSIPASLVKQLRDDTGAPMMECKKALVETNGDLEAAKQVLRERGAAVHAKRAGKEATAGVIAAAVSPDRRAAAMIELRCETDFVGRNEEFIALAARIAEAVLEGAPGGAGTEEVLAFKLDGGSVRDAVADITGKIGERIELGRVLKRATPDGLLDTYIHHDKSKGVLIEMTGGDDSLADLAHSIAIHIAWGDPEYISRDEIQQERIEKELETERQRAINEGKPEQAAQKIAEGRVNKLFFQRVCLLDQPFMGQKESVADLINQAKKEGIAPRVVSFTRFAIGA
jgi:elongation factor Ts